MRAVIYLKEFSLSVVLLSLAVSVFLGKLQELIGFNSVASEICLFIFSFTFGLVALVSSIKIKR